MKIIFSLLLLTLSLSLLAHRESFLPENNLKIGINPLAPTGITEADFHAVQADLKAIYVPMATAQGGKLTFRSDWKSSTVNAYAQRFGVENEDGEELPPFDDWRVIFLGGLARHKDVTRDGFTLIVCHELGHHFGGAPTYNGETSWASNEGQADTFSVSKCLRRLWEKADNASAIQGKVISPVVIQACSDQWKTEAENNLCLRVSLASQSIGNLFASLVTFGKPPQFETPDPKVVTSTQSSHPKAQCRLDTYLQASLCAVSFYTDFGKDDETIGACHPKNGDVVGNRPLCWFKPSL
jgi:hypothetical protein